MALDAEGGFTSAGTGARVARDVLAGDVPLPRASGATVTGVGPEPAPSAVEGLSGPTEAGCVGVVRAALPESGAFGFQSRFLRASASSWSAPPRWVLFMNGTGTLVT